MSGASDRGWSHRDISKAYMQKYVWCSFVKVMISPKKPTLDMIIAKTAVQKWCKTNRKYSRKSRIAAWKQPLKGSRKDFSEPRLLCPNFKCKRKNSVWSRGPNTLNDASINYLHSIVVTITVLHLVWKVLQSVCTGVAVVSCIHVADAGSVSQDWLALS